MMSPDEYRQLMRRARGQGLALRLACCFLWRTGARPGEMRAVCWENVDWALGVIRLPSLKLNAEDRVIGLDGRMLRLLRWLHCRRQPPADTWIFLDAAGQPWTGIGWSKTFRAWADRAELPKLTCYDLRRAFLARATRAA